jgi:nitrogen regulatory protein PII
MTSFLRQNLKSLFPITESARTGEHGDGVIFVSTIDQAINIATLDKGEKVLQ